LHCATFCEETREINDIFFAKTISDKSTDFQFLRKKSPLAGNFLVIVRGANLAVAPLETSNYAFGPLKEDLREPSCAKDAARSSSNDNELTIATHNRAISIKKE